MLGCQFLPRPVFQETHAKTDPAVALSSQQDLVLDYSLI